MEFLSQQFKESHYPVHLVLHSVLTQRNGGDAQNTPSYKVVPLPFNPTDGFHEYRFGRHPLHRPISA